MKKVVHFGAGNIGRGFIGALFAESGYHVTFVDIAPEVIRLLNEEGGYYVRTASEPQQAYAIHNVSGINNQTDPDDVVAAIGEATFLTTAIGPKVLPFIAPLIARALMSRVQKNPQKLYVIACENQINATDLLKEEVFKALDPDTIQALNGKVSFLNSAVDRIVPAQHNEQPLDVLVEDYHEWIVESTEKIPEVTGMQTVPDLAPYIERKLFTVNTGHAVTAYLGYLAGKKKIHETLQDPSIYQQVKATIEETGSYLIQKYHFDPAVHEAYIEKILHRFQNPQLNDDVTRVGRSPLRKLGSQDRLVKPAVEASRLGLPYTHLARAIAACLCFDAAEDKEAQELQNQLRNQGAASVLESVCGLPKNNQIATEVLQNYEELSKVRHA
ncbi:mannitol-1-phosphate 5-dehydrogenase [Sporolactobacillus sp. THM7-4]|nr:mannitol-1-phosphate 5-dehydrogenase [Sporolactobacillus sp. THM7-4]